MTRLSKGTMSNQSLPFHDESTVLVHAATDRVFAHLDDAKSLSAHMGKSSMMMIGSRMSIEIDAGGGRAFGSKVGVYARWCTKRMADDAARYFDPTMVQSA